MKAAFSTLVIFIFPFAMVAQMTIYVDNVPAYFMPLLDDIYLAGSFNDWNPSSSEHILEETEGGYQITISGTPGEVIEFKFTRGDWASVETNEDGSFLPDRTLVFEDQGEEHLSIAGWEDFSGTHTVTNHVMVLDSDQLLPLLNRERRIWVSLPPGYHQSSEHYPVIYLQDGQNVFDAATSFSGEWQVDETMNSLPEICTQAIVVAIDNGQEHRIDEYSPWENPDYGGGEGASYALDLINHIKPLIDEEFRTLPQREFTGVGGSSLGALIAMYCVLEHQEVFSKAFIASPSFWFSDEVYELAENSSPLDGTKMYFVAGNNESATMVPNMDEMVTVLQQQGFGLDQLNMVTHEDGQHSEWYWAREFESGYKWLFDNNLSSSIEAQSSRKQKAWPNPNEGKFSLELESEIAEVDVYNLDGQRMVSIPGESSKKLSINLQVLHQGLYVLLIKNVQGEVFYERIRVE